VTNTAGLTVEGLGSSVWHNSLKVDSNKPGVADSIELDFAPPPTESIVLRMYRSVCYNCGTGKISPDAPTVENLVSGLAEKLKSPTPTVVANYSAANKVVAVYVWTRDGKFLSAAELKSRLRYPARCIEPPELDQARTNVNIDFQAVVATLEPNFANTCGTVARAVWFQEGGIITHFEVTFSDVAGLLSAVAKSAGLIAAKKGSQHQQELQRANQNRAPL